MRQMLMSTLATLLISVVYKSYWKFAEWANRNGRIAEAMRRYYLERWCCYIGRYAQFDGEPVMPHGFHGIHISSGARIGRNVVIFQNVTIGSNTLKDSSRYGSPKIGDNVFIGAGAAIIGNVTVGDNCRIGANCVVVKDMPPNTVAVIGEVRYITKEMPMDNRFTSWKN